MTFPSQQPPQYGSTYDHPTEVQAAFPAARRKSRAPLIAGLAAAVVLIGGGVTAALVVANRSDAQIAASASEPAGAPTLSPSTLTPLDERSACHALVPLLDEVADMANTFLKDGAAPPRDKVKDLRGRLETLAAVAPADMKPDISTQIHAVIAMGGGRLDTTEVTDSGLKLVKKCGPYGPS